MGDERRWIVRCADGENGGVMAAEKSVGFGVGTGDVRWRGVWRERVTINVCPVWRPRSFVLLVARTCRAGFIFWRWDCAVEGDGSSLSSNGSQRLWEWPGGAG